MEPTPEPFRMQSNVVLTVSFKEYINFIDKWLDKVNYLSTETYLLKKYLRDGDDKKLYQTFLQSIGYAVAKELHYAEARKKDATCILHSIPCNDVKSSKEIEQLYLDVKRYTLPILYRHMEDHDFSLPKTFRKNNMILWQYANVLIYFSLMSGPEWIFNKEEL
jgi:hypothetical protein